MATPSNTPIIAVTATAPDGKVSRRSIDEIRWTWTFCGRVKRGSRHPSTGQAQRRVADRLVPARPLAKAEALAKEVNEIAPRRRVRHEKGRGPLVRGEPELRCRRSSGDGDGDESPRPTVCGECFMEHSGECL